MCVTSNTAYVLLSVDELLTCIATVVVTASESFLFYFLIASCDVSERLCFLETLDSPETFTTLVCLFSSLLSLPFFLVNLNCEFC